MTSFTQRRINHYNLLNTTPIHTAIHATKPEQNDIVHNKLLLETSAQVYADSLPIPVRDMAGGGWNYTKDVTGASKFNYYFFGNHTANPMKLSELLGTFIVGSIHTFENNKSVPFIVLYTLPTGVGDAAAWYKSRISYSINLSGKKLYSGEKIMLYTGEKPTYHSKLRAFKLDVLGVTGSADLNEIVNLISAHCDSEVPVNHSVTINNLGWTNSEIGLNIELK